MTALRKAHLKQHFTDAEDINALMCDMLGPVHGLSLLEPSVGHGAFLANLRGKPSSIDVVDVDADAIDATCRRFTKLKLVPHHSDFIDLFLADIFTRDHPILSKQFDAVISNPPYGLYLSRDYRARLKRAFPTLYVRESYGLFFVFSVSRLREGGRYVFLLPDTFLSSINHKPLRQFIAAQAAPTAIIRFPSKRFETINFGYGNLCIIAGHHRPLAPTDKIAWLDAFEPGAPLTLEALHKAEAVTGRHLQAQIGGWGLQPLLGNSAEPTHGWSSLGDLAECRTGIYTGDNVRFIGYDPGRVTRRLNGHPIDWKRTVLSRPLHPDETANGLCGPAHYVPLIRGGHREPFDVPSSALDWSPAALLHYRTDKKARFQNATFYFRDGLSVPMVSTKRISAALMTGAVFDQGVVGVFPKEKQHTDALLLYLNSQHASRAIKAIVNGSANNSANYMKRLPIPPFTAAACKRARQIVAAAKKTGSLAPRECEDFVASLLASSPRKIARQVAGLSAKKRPKVR